MDIFVVSFSETLGLQRQTTKFRILTWCVCVLLLTVLCVYLIKEWPFLKNYFSERKEQDKENQYVLKDIKVAKYNLPPFY